LDPQNVFFGPPQNINFGHFFWGHKFR
jgi:hypothetical protein